jgi:hypothetical protein
MAISISRTKLGLVVAALLSLSFLQAQEAKVLARHPGDVIKYQVKFEGPNAERIKNVTASLNLRSAAPKDQAGFNSGFGTRGPVPPSSPKTFTVEMTVPENTATGDYYLFVVARADEGSAEYQDGQGFTTPVIHIDNPKKFSPPEITVTPLP